MLIQLAEFMSQPMLLDHSFAMRLHSMIRSGEASQIEPVRNDIRLAAETLAKSAKGQAARITAVLPISGMIDQRDSWMLRMFGGTALDSLMEAVDICMNEDRIGGIVFDVSSPGGSAYGVKEAADSIFAARSMKPIVSVSNSIMASAAAYIGLSASRVYATPSSVTGSIGVAWIHEDESKMLENAGIKTTVCRIPEYKMEGHPSEPLTEQAKSHMDERCADLYEMFTSDLAKYRKVDQSTVKESYGKGRVLSAKDAAACGMVDKVATFSEVCDGMRSGSIARSLAQTNRMEGCIDSSVLKNRMDAAML